jgi:hypothetical protein
VHNLTQNNHNSSVFASSFSALSRHKSNHENFELNNSEWFSCYQNYSRRAYYRYQKFTPPLLYTFPGSGNTWTRLLIEYGTGILTGSMYNDGSLVKILPGELHCDRTVSVIKCHPFHYPFTRLKTGSVYRKCMSARLRFFTRAILVIRNPYDSIWSDYQRYVTESHVGKILLSEYNHSKYIPYVKLLSTKYMEMVEFDYPDIIEDFGNDDIFFTKYEDLINPSKQLTILHDMVAFLKYPTTMDRLKCAIILSERAQVT